MTPLLNDLITGAIQLAGDAGVAHAARLWQSEGGLGARWDGVDALSPCSLI